MKGIITVLSAALFAFGIQHNLWALDTSKTLSLGRCLSIAAENNKSVVIAKKAEDIAKRDIDIAYSGYLPRINAGLSHTFLNNEPEGKFGSLAVPQSQKSFNTFQVDIEQNIYDFGATSSRYNYAKTLMELSRVETQKVKNDVSLSVAVTYFDALRAQRFREVAEQEVKQMEGHLRVVQSLFKEGVITRNDLLQAEVRLSDARQRLLSAKDRQQVMRAYLNNLLNLPLNDKRPLSDEPDNITIKDMIIDELTKEAIENRPEVTALRKKIEAERLVIEKEKTRYMPRIYGSLGYEYNENRYMVHQDEWSALFGIKINLYSGGETKASVLKAEAQLSKTEEELKKLKDDIRLETVANYIRLNDAYERIGVTKEAIRQAQENLRINEVRYKERVGIAVEVMDAQSILTTARTNYYNALYDYRTNEAQLLSSVGKNIKDFYR